MKINSLVSVVVVAYNSSSTIVETLDSVRSQTYKNIELIISDDCSTDNTVEICKKWIEENKSHFVRVVLLSTDKNGGIPKNFNMGITVVRGEWIKGIAADDILLPECIADNLEFIESNLEAQVVFSEIREFCGESSEREFYKKYPEDNHIAYFAISAREQFRAYICGDFWAPAPSAFIKTSLLKKYPYNETYSAIEDFPQWCKFTSSGVRLFFMNKPTVLYRVNSNSVSTKNGGVFYAKRFMDSRKLFFLCELRQYLLDFGMVDRVRKYEREFLLYDLMIALFKNKKTVCSSFFKHFLSRLLKIFMR